MITQSFKKGKKVNEQYIKHKHGTSPKTYFTYKKHKWLQEQNKLQDIVKTIKNLNCFEQAFKFVLKIIVGFLDQQNKLHMERREIMEKKMKGRNETENFVKV